MSAELAIQEALYRTLRADANLAALLAVDVYEGSPTGSAVYDHVEQVPASEDDSKFPYVVVGDDTAAEFDTDDVLGQETTVTLHIWDRYRGRKRVKQIGVVIYALLHTFLIPVVGQNTVYCYWEFSGSVPDSDPMTQHQVMRFRIVTQQ